MKERPDRLQAIRRIIRENRIESQETLLETLAKMGYMVTQATLSRDLKTLKVGKISDGRKGSFYTLTRGEMPPEEAKSYIQDFLRGFVSIDTSSNIGVIRTLPGHANSVALALDQLDFPEILGTIAGDDTVFLVMRDGTGKGDLLAALHRRIPDMEV